MAANSRFAVAVHALALVAWHEDICQNSREIADSVATNPVVIRRLLAQLAKVGIIKSAHGPKGGFRLGRQPTSITLFDIYTAVEEGGFFALPEKANADCPIACHMKKILDGVFAQFEARVTPALKQTSLADIVRRLPKPKHLKSKK
jgi:Rrf2 family protein